MTEKDLLRFKEKVVEAAPDACWLWTGLKSHNGYGQLMCKIRDGYFRPVRAHRIAWEAVNGPIPEGMYVLHSCDTPACCNPKHLFLGTAKDNIHDAVRKGRHPHHESHGMHRLTKDDVDVIRALCCIGVRRRLVAALYGTSRTYVNDIHWKSIWKGI